MARRRQPLTSPRKVPVQARSAQLVDHILQGAIRVLSREGAARFTTIRVAEAAGVSVGSLYQYFPNKEAILFRLQTDEWEQTGNTIETILSDTTKTPHQRLRIMIRVFFQSECDEAPLRSALDAATPNYHDAPESRAKRRRSRDIVDTFVAEAAPSATPRQRRLAGHLMFMTVTSVGKRVSEERPSPKDVLRWADATSQMVWAYLEDLRPSSLKAVRSARTSP